MLIGTVLPIAGLLVALGAVVLGILASLGGATTIRARVRSGRTEPQPVHEITSGGYVEAVGPIDDLNTDPITAPFSGTDCAAYEYRLLQQDSDSWQVAEGGDATSFVLEDDTGASVEVQPADATPNTEWETVASPGAGESLPEASQNALRTHPAVDTEARPEYFAAGIDSGRQYQERRLDLGEEAYAYGKAKRGNVHSARIDESSSSEFAIGTEPAGSFGGSYPKALLQVLVGMGLVVAGVYAGVLLLGSLGVDLPIPGGVGPGEGVVLSMLGLLSVPSRASGQSVHPSIFEPVGPAPALVSGDVLVGGVIGAIVTAAGLYLTWKGGSGLWTAARIFINQPVDPGEAAALEGIVELEGTVRPAGDGAIESPYGGEEAAVCEFRVRQQETEKRRVRDSDGNWKTKRKKVWRTKATGSFERNFAVESGGQTIEVDPEGAETTLGGYETIHERNSTSTLPEPVRLRLSAGEKRGIGDPAAFLSQNASNRRRFQERTLAVGDSIHLYGGTVEDRSDPEPLVVEGDEEYTIAKGTELRTVIRRGAGGLVYLVVGLPLLAIGGFVFLVVLGGVF